MPSQNPITPKSRTRGTTAATTTTTLRNRGGMWSRVYQRVLLAKLAKHGVDKKLLQLSLRLGEEESIFIHLPLCTLRRTEDCTVDVSARNVSRIKTDRTQRA